MHISFVGNPVHMPEEEWKSWEHELQKQLPDLTCSIWTSDMSSAELSRADYAIAWKPVGGALASLPNIKAIFSLGAGVDHLFSDPDLPKHLPITRVVDPNLTQRMTEYVVMHVLLQHRRHPYFLEQRQDGFWAKDYDQPAASDRTIGIMGLGELGLDSARSLARLGFNVRGWSRSAKQESVIETFAGDEQLTQFLNGLDVLVCLLPLTASTQNIINMALLTQLPVGAYVINVARGAHLVERDLLSAIEMGHISGATLDVFRTEPLPSDHPFWREPRIMITPHNAADSDPRTISQLIVENIHRLEHGEPMNNLVDAGKGY